MYVIIRFEGFTAGLIKYGVYFVYFYALIIPFIFKKIKIDRKTDLFLSLILFLILFSLIFFYTEKDYGYYLFLGEEQTIEICNQLNYSYPFVFIPAPNELLIYDPPSRFTYFEYLRSEQEFRDALNQFNSESFYVFLHPYNDFHYQQALNEDFCDTFSDCREYLNNIVNIIENEYNMTKIIDLSEHGDYGAIYLRNIS